MQASISVDERVIQVHSYVRELMGKMPVAFEQVAHEWFMLPHEDGFKTNLNGTISNRQMARVLREAFNLQGRAKLFLQEVDKGRFKIIGTKPQQK